MIMAIFNSISYVIHFTITYHHGLFHIQTLQEQETELCTLKTSMKTFSSS